MTQEWIFTPVPSHSHRKKKNHVPDQNKKWNLVLSCSRWKRLPLPSELFTCFWGHLQHHQGWERATVAERGGVVNESTGACFCHCQQNGRSSVTDSWTFFQFWWNAHLCSLAHTNLNHSKVTAHGEDNWIKQSDYYVQNYHLCTMWWKWNYILVINKMFFPLQVPFPSYFLWHQVHCRLQ